MRPTSGIPSVTHDGRIIYTRWDYVDRYGCTAHLPWITTLDGRDSRAVHGNFAPDGRAARHGDWTAARSPARTDTSPPPPRTTARRSARWCVIDPDVADDDAMAPVQAHHRPRSASPKARVDAQVYGTPWPLSEDLLPLRLRRGHAPGRSPRPGTATTGSIWSTASGTRSCSIATPAIACLSPIPLRRPRRYPPVAPELARRGPDTNPRRAVRTRSEAPRRGHRSPSSTSTTA